MILNIFSVILKFKVSERLHVVGKFTCPCIINITIVNCRLHNVGRFLACRGFFVYSFIFFPFLVASFVLSLLIPFSPSSVVFLSLFSSLCRYGYLLFSVFLLCLIFSNLLSFHIPIKGFFFISCFPLWFIRFSLRWRYTISNQPWINLPIQRSGVFELQISQIWTRTLYNWYCDHWRSPGVFSWEFRKEIILLKLANLVQMAVVNLLTTVCQRQKEI
jgi:hypothetical protein